MIISVSFINKINLHICSLNKDSTDKCNKYIWECEINNHSMNIKDRFYYLLCLKLPFTAPLLNDEILKCEI